MSIYRYFILDTVLKVVVSISQEQAQIHAFPLYVIPSPDAAAFAAKPYRRENKCKYSENVWIKTAKFRYFLKFRLFSIDFGFTIGANPNHYIPD